MTSTSAPRPLRWMDRFGVCASTVCAVHCAAGPVLLAALPAWGAVAWAESVEMALLVGMSTLAVLAMAWGWHCHRRFAAGGLLVAGLVLAWASWMWLPDGGWHHAGLAGGGVLIALAHGMNQRLTHRHRPCPGCASSALAPPR